MQQISCSECTVDGQSDGNICGRETFNKEFCVLHVQSNATIFYLLV